MAASRLSYNPAHALNAVCPYFTMFPLEYPLRILKKQRNAKRVLDPFCGRGTTLYAARSLGMDSWGIDTSPVAVAIARAKLSHSSIADALDLAYEIVCTEPEQKTPKGAFWKLAFHSETLKEVCKLRSALRHRRSDAAALLRAIALGCLHGPLTKNPKNPSYFSNQMPRTFAAKPEYAVQYWTKNKLAPEWADVIDVLSKKAFRIGDASLGLAGHYGQVLQGDAQRQHVFNRIPARINTIITSPPYYGMVSYVQDQWLRNWFLGASSQVDYSRGKQLSHSGTEAFVSSLARVWNNVGDVAAQDAEMFIRFGSIPSCKQDAKAILLASLKASNHAWHVVSVRNAMTAEEGKRQAEQMGAGSKAIQEYDFHVLLS